MNLSLHQGQVNSLCKKQASPLHVANCEAGCEQTPLNLKDGSFNSLSGLKSDQKGGSMIGSWKHCAGNMWITYRHCLLISICRTDGFAYIIDVATPHNSIGLENHLERLDGVYIILSLLHILYLSQSWLPWGSCAVCFKSFCNRIDVARVLCRSFH